MDLNLGAYHLLVRVKPAWRLILLKGDLGHSRISFPLVPGVMIIVVVWILRLVVALISAWIVVDRIDIFDLQDSQVANRKTVLVYIEV